MKRDTRNLKHELMLHMSGIVRQLEAKIDILQDDLKKANEKIDNITNASEGTITDNNESQENEITTGAGIQELSAGGMKTTPLTVVDVRNTRFVDYQTGRSATLIDQFRGSAIVWDAQVKVWRWYSVYAD